MGNTVNNIVKMLNMAKSNYTDHIGHFAVYRNIESLCCTPGTNINIVTSKNIVISTTHQ